MHVEMIWKRKNGMVTIALPDEASDRAVVYCYSRFVLIRRLIPQPVIPEVVIGNPVFHVLEIWIPDKGIRG